MRIVDLSHPLHTDMQVYPGDPAVRIGHALSYDHDGVRVSTVELGTHSGTHVDAPCHMSPTGRTLTQVQLEELTGPAQVISLPEPGEAELISWRHVADQVGRTTERIVIIATGWDQYFGTKRYLKHPVISDSVVKELWNRGMRVLGLDTLSPDSTAPSEAGAGFAVHEFILGSDGLIVENLRGLSSLPRRCTVGFFPLPLHAADGAPIRAVAWVDENEQRSAPH